MTDVDFGRHSDDYADHRPGFPPSFYERLERLVPLRDARALDLATGPGTVALELAARGADVLGVDAATGQVAVARRVAAELRLDERARFEVADAEATGLPDAGFDLITAGQCWHWFDHDAALAEATRLLQPGGLLAIAEYSYLAEHVDVARETEELVLRFNPSWSMSGWTGLACDRIDRVIRGGLSLVEAFCYHHDEEFSHERWRGRMRTCNGVGSGGLPPDEVKRFDAALADLLASRHPDPISVTHRVWCIVARRPA